MIKHVILWKLKDGISPDEKDTVILGIKNALEGLQGQIPGLAYIRVLSCALPSSNADLMLDSGFETYEALLAYRDHPAHIAAADTFVRPNMQQRLCLDYEE